MEHIAIYKLYPLVVKINETNDGVLTAYDANDNAVSINMSVVNVKAEELREEKLAKEEAHKQAKASALAKLTALGLTEEEVKSIL